MMCEHKKEKPLWQNRNAARCIMRYFYRIFKCVVPLSELLEETKKPRKWLTRCVTRCCFLCGRCHSQRDDRPPVLTEGQHEIFRLQKRPPHTIPPLHCFTATWMRNYPACCMLEHTCCCLISGATADGGEINGSGILEIKMISCSKGI